MPIDMIIEKRLNELEASFRTNSMNSANLQAYVSFICQNSILLPGMQLLSMTACCLFGLRPPLPELEKQYITELMMWGQAVTSQVTVT
jgi:hypothetical protein